MRNQEKSSKSYEKEITTKLQNCLRNQKTLTIKQEMKKGPTLQKKSLHTRKLQRNQNGFPKSDEKGRKVAKTAREITTKLQDCMTNQNKYSKSNKK